MHEYLHCLNGVIYKFTVVYIVGDKTGHANSASVCGVGWEGMGS